MNILLVLVVFLFVAIIDFRPLVREKQKKEIFIYCSMFVAVLALWILHASGVEIPSPLILAGKLLKEVLYISY